jgi:hypothetical protein
MTDDTLKKFIGCLVEITACNGCVDTGVLQFNDKDMYRAYPYFLDPYDSANRPRYKKSHIKKIEILSEIKNGDKVRMNEKYHVSKQNLERVFTTRSGPFLLGYTWCIFLEDWLGCYALDGLDKVDG